MVSTVLLEKAAPCNVLMYWTNHILQPPSHAPVNRLFPFSRASYTRTFPKVHIFNIKVRKKHISESCKLFITYMYNITCSTSVEHCLKMKFYFKDLDVFAYLRAYACLVVNYSFKK